MGTFVVSIRSTGYIPAHRPQRVRQSVPVRQSVQRRSLLRQSVPVRQSVQQRSLLRQSVPV
jgi:hypothetical protein